MASARLRLIDRPSPVPPKRRVTPPSTCWKDSKMSSMRSGGMPIPVSATVMMRRSPASRVSQAAVRVTEPASVNLMALERRLKRICRRRDPSSRIFGGAPLRSMMSFNPFSSALSDQRRAASSSSSQRSASPLLMIRVPLSILAASRMSFTRARMVSPAPCISLTRSRTSGDTLSSARRTCVTPRIPFNGVRIS